MMVTSLLVVPRRLKSLLSVSVSGLLNPSFVIAVRFGRTFCGTFHRTSGAISVPCIVRRFFSTRLIDDLFDAINVRISEKDHRTGILVQVIEAAADCSPSSSAMTFLDESHLVPDTRLILSAVYELREKWRLAVLGFMWGEKLNVVDDDARILITWILGYHLKFNTAWIMIREWQRLSLKIRLPMLVMIDRYAAANIPGKAIWTFNFMEKFRLCPDEEAYHFLLTSLCKHGFIGEAEEFMLLSKNLFSLEVKWFNIILNGWCKINIDVLEAKRIWKKMASYCIAPDAISHTHMISCFSNVGNLFDALRLWDGMKKRGWAPGLEVYNSLVYVLTRENCIEEALKIIGKARADGLKPNSNTYNSMIRVLRDAGKVEEAKYVLFRMEEEGVTPTAETYCSLIGVGDIKELDAVLERMEMVGVELCDKMFMMIISKLFSLQKPEQALRMWEEMKRREIAPRAAHYRWMAEGLSKCGMIAVAREFVGEMRLRGFPEDRKLQERLVKVHSIGNSVRKRPQVGQRRNIGPKQCVAVIKKDVRRANLFK